MLVVIALLLVVVVVGTGGLLGLLWLTGKAQATQGKLLVLDDNGRLVLLDAHGSERVLAEDTTSEGFLYPAPSPDGRYVAYVASNDQGTALIALDLQSGERKELYSNPRDLPLLYFIWAPDGKTISFLTYVQARLGVYVVPTDGSQSATLITPEQAAAYFAWTPDGQRLLLHLNGSVFEDGTLATFALGNSEPQMINNDLGYFNAPAWSSDGSQVFFVAQPRVQKAAPSVEDVVSILTRAAPDGSGVTELVREPGAALFFSRAPESDQLAYTTWGIAPQRFGALTVVDGRTGESRTVSRPDERVAAFFWSPDGQQLAYLTREADDSPRSPHTWHIVSAAGGDARILTSFTPNVAFIGMINFFDAYALSLSVWSPDGRRLTYATPEGVHVVDIQSGTTKHMSNGELGLWVR